MARFRTTEHQIAVDQILGCSGLTVERVRRFDHTAVMPERESWPQWAFRITRGGTRYVAYAGQSYTLAPHTIVWHAPLRDPVMLRALPGTGFDQIVVRLSAQRWNRWLGEQPHFGERHADQIARQARQPVFALTVVPPQVLLVVRDLLALNEALRRSTYAVEQQCALLLHLIGELAFDQHNRPATSEQRRRVETAQAHLARDLSQPPSLPTLAATLNVSPRQLQRDFLACTGLTPRRYLNIMRLSEANALLADTSVPIAASAARLGYVSQAHFSAAFRQIYHCSPREVRAVTHGNIEHDEIFT